MNPLTPITRMMPMSVHVPAYAEIFIMMVLWSWAATSATTRAAWSDSSSQGCASANGAAIPA